MGLGLRPLGRHRQSLTQTAAGRWRAMDRRWSCGGSITRANAAVVLVQGNVHDSMAGIWAAPMLLHRLRQHGFGGELEVKKRVPVATATFALAPRRTGQVAPVVRQWRIPDCSPSQPFPHSLGVPGKTPGPFQGERDFHAVAKPLVVFPGAARISLPSAVPIQEGHQAVLRG